MATMFMWCRSVSPTVRGGMAHKRLRLPLRMWRATPFRRSVASSSLIPTTHPPVIASAPPTHELLVFLFLGGRVV